MPPHGLVEHKLESRQGELTIWYAPRMGEPDRPILLAIPSTPAMGDAFANLAEALDVLADLCVLQPASGAVTDVAAAVADLLQQQFSSRRVVLVGDAGGAVVALAVRAPNLARVVALEPTLITQDLWPIDAGLAAHDIYTPSGDYTAVLQDLTAPADVVLGGVSLGARRDADQAPGLVTPAAHIRLAATPNVRLHRVRGAGHEVMAQAPQAVLDFILEACRRAGESLAPERLRLDEPLLEATPLTARRVLYHGPEAPAFAEALARRNPAVTVETAEPADAAVFAVPPSAQEIAQAASALKTGGYLIARWTATAATLRAALEPHGLALCVPFDDAGTGVIRARKLGAGEALAAPLMLQTVAYASFLMDVRTRLPARALASEPDLQVVYGAPPQDFPPTAADQPKILVIQRPGQQDAEVWRALMARAIRGGWLVVIEYDDDPGLVAQVQRRQGAIADLDLFAYAHAVQTSTPKLVELFATRNPEVLLFPNAVFDLPPFPQEARPQRVLYAALGRGNYAIEVAQALESVVTACRGAQFDVVGDRLLFGALPTRVKRYHPYLSYEAYLSMMGQCQVTLSPIEPNPRNEAKSDAKFLDAAATGALIVASPTAYGGAIEHGVTGFIAKDVGDWAPLLITALNDTPRRETITRNAWAQVRDQRMFADQIPLRRDAYRALWARRDELNAALLARFEGLAAAVANG